MLFRSEKTTEQSSSIARFLPSSIPSSASLVTTQPGSLSEPLRMVVEYGKELPDQTFHLTSTTEMFGTLPRQSVEVVLCNSFADVMKVSSLPKFIFFTSFAFFLLFCCCMFQGLITISHAQHQVVDYKELINVLNE